jgi:transitional endoplasmic reticulum ATPase
MNVQQKATSLKVIDGMLEDSHKGIVRISSYIMKRLEVSNGEPVAIHGKRTTVARAMPAFSDQCSPEQVQLDGVLRENAGVGIGEIISLEAVPYEKARTVILAPVVPGWVPGGDYELSHLKQKLLGLAVVVDDHVSIPLFSGQHETFIVEGVLPRGVVTITKDTAIRFKGSEGSENSHERVRYDDVGGLALEVQHIREIVELPLKYPQLFRILGIEAPRGILLYGPPGTGKTLIARAVASETEAHFIHVDGPEIMHKYYGESEARLRQVFQEAKQKAPSIIFLDEIDAIAPPRAEVHGDVEKRVVAQLLALMDGLEARGNIIVLAATNVPELIDPALRRPGRFDREIAINVPDERGRLQILTIHTRGMNTDTDVSLEYLAKITHGFVGADLLALCREAGMNALRRYFQESHEITVGDLDLRVTMQDFVDALAYVEPSATRTFAIEIPSCTWDDVGGMESIKEHLQSMVVWPLRYPQLYNQFGIDTPKGILFSGPPGTGKTLAARALAGETRVNFIPVNSPLLFSHWEGEAEKALHDVFKKAKQASPCILLFDEIDSIAPTRRNNNSTLASRLVSQLLMELDGIEALKQVVVLATTNRIDMVDPALLRSGRFDLVLDFPLPDVEERIKILAVHLQDKPLSGEVEILPIAEASEGLAGSDMRAITERAAYLAVSEVVQKKTKDICIRQIHLIRALKELLAEKKIQV